MRMRFAVALLLAVSATSAAAQAPDAGAAAYRSFFELVARLGRFVPSGSIRLASPTLQDDLAFADSEMQLLTRVAADYEARSLEIGPMKSRITFEARLRSIESGDSSEWLARETRLIDERNDRILAASIQEARRVLGESRFEAVAAYLREAAPHCYITPCGPKPTARK
jgi:hypothetical protein